MKHLKQLLIIFLLLVLSYPTIRDLMVPGGFTSHDFTHHVIRQIEMDRLLNDGQIPPRWADNLNKGYGYPVFLFNYPLPPLLGQLFVSLGFNYIESIKWVFGVSLMISSVGMYLFIRSILGNKHLWAAFLGGAFYLFAPIRFSTVYVSAAIGSALALGIVPWVFWATNRLLQTGSLFYLLVGSFLLGLLITAHNVTTVLFLPILGVFALLSWRLNSYQWGRLGKLILMIFLGFGLSAWFWIPSVVEKEFIVYDSKMTGFYQDQFPTLMQLINSPWGYGFSKAGTDQDGMSFQVGYLHLVALLLLVISLLLYRQDRRFLSFGLFSLTVFTISVFLMLDISLPIWDQIKLLQYVQFPWRILSVAVFAGSLAAALIVTKLPFKRLIFFLLLVLVVYSNRHHFQINLPTSDHEDHYRSLRTTTTAFDEHLPKWGRRMGADAPAKLQILKGGGKIREVENKSHLVRFESFASTELEIKFNQFYFPGWEITVDDQKVDINYQRGGEDQGFPIFTVPPGTHVIKAEFKDTLVRSLADNLTLGAIFIWIVILVMTVKRRLLNI